jgi:acetoin utilization protein AcuB
LVKDWMSRHLVKVPPKYRLAEAAQLMFEHRISHLPVVEKGRLKGIVSNRDLKRAWSERLGEIHPDLFWEKIRKETVGDIMTEDPNCIKEYDTVYKAAVVMQEKRISCLPVLDSSGDLKAMLSLGDVFKALMQEKGLSNKEKTYDRSSPQYVKTEFEHALKIPFA